jgi:hypothetical protein
LDRGLDFANKSLALVNFWVSNIMAKTTEKEKKNLGL